MFLSNHFCYIRIFLYFYWHTHTHKLRNVAMIICKCLRVCMTAHSRWCSRNALMTDVLHSPRPPWILPDTPLLTHDEISVTGFFFSFFSVMSLTLPHACLFAFFFIRFFFLCPFGRIESINFAKLPPNFISLLTTSGNCLSFKVIYFLMNSAVFPN